MELKRRTFVKLGLAVSAATGLGLPTFNAFAAKKGKSKVKAGQWMATTCQGCTTWCPAEVFVQDGRATKVRGNQLSKQNEGILCPKSHIGLQELYDPDRVKVPMKRTNPKKGRGVDPKFIPISWDEALGTIADKMMELRKAGKPEQFMVNRGRYSYMRDTIYAALPKVFGSPNGISHSAICAEAEKFGSYYTEGYWGYRDYDLDNTKYLLIWGADPLSSNRMIPATIKRFGKVLDNATVAVVDPRMNTSAAKAHEWLPVIPGTDGALAVAVAHTLLTEGLWYKKFVGDFTGGKNLFKKGLKLDEKSFKEVHTNGVIKWWNEELKDKDANWAAKICGISADQIKGVARGMGKAAPNVIVWLGPGACMHVRGAYSAMAIHALNGLVGSTDHKGGPFQYVKQPVAKLPKYSKYQDKLAKKHSKMKKIDQRGFKNLPALKKGKSGGGVVTSNLCQGMLEKNPNEIKVAIGYMNNFVFSSAGTKDWEEAFANLPFFAHITTNASEMTQFADIVLPSTITQFEKLGYVKTKANGYSAVTLIQPVVKPFWDVRMDETEIIFDLSVKLKERGFSNLYDYFTKEFKDPETGKKPKNGVEFTEINLKIQMAPMWDGKKKVGGDTFKSWADFRKKGMWNSDMFKFGKKWGKFKTKTKKFEFYSVTLKKALEGHAKKHKTSVDNIMKVTNYTARGEKCFIPHYEPPYQHGTSEKYPFKFVDYKSKLNREGRSANTSWYQEFKHVDIGDVGWNDVLKLNPVDAKKLGVKDGDNLKIESVTGSYELEAKLWEGIRPGSVTKCYGQGHWAYGNIAAEDYEGAVARGVNNNEIMPADIERLSGSAARNGGFTAVQISKA
ncbi:MAG: molybdopterin-dependent oxidoreductase [Bacteriovoracaceae bacterium]|nr:molybdopterin-dependent oxidoreductase [Bacteriovoracaceae bacterium]